MSIWRKISDSTKRLGRIDGTLFAAARALHVITRGRCRIVKYRFVAQPIRDGALTAATSSGITVERATAGDRIVRQFPRPAHVLARRFAEGAICFAAARNGTLMGFIWIKTGEYMEDEVRCLYKVEPRQVAVWDFDVWVAPEFRLSRAFMRLWDAANAFMREQGYRWSLSRISAFNAGSLSSHQRLGIVHIHSAIFVMLGRLQLSLLTCPPYLHLTVSPHRYPIVRLNAPDAPPHRADPCR